MDPPVARAFPPTRHSTLAALRSADEAERRRALEALAAAYWRPVYGYLRLHWRMGHDEAADLAQDFFAELVDKELLARFDPARARLRTYLRVCIDGLVANEQKAARRLKRGGGRPDLPLDDARAEVERELGVAASPEALFEREWARALFARALADVRERCAREGKAGKLAVFEAYELGGEAERPSYAELARRFGIAVTDVTNWLSWGRRALREAVVARLRDCTASDEELRAELRALLGTERP